MNKTIKKTIKFFLLILIFSILTTYIIGNITVHMAVAKDLNYIKENLDKLGVSEEYSDNIIEYIQEMDVSNDEVNKVVDESMKIYEDAEVMGKDGFSIQELFSIYNNINKVAKEMDIDIKFNFFKREAILKNKNNGDILLKCNESDARKYYKNLRAMASTKDDYYQLIEGIRSNIISNKEDIENEKYNDNIEVNSDDSEKINNNQSTGELDKDNLNYNGNKNNLVENKYLDNDTESIEQQQKGIGINSNKMSLDLLFWAIISFIILSIVLIFLEYYRVYHINSR